MQDTIVPDRPNISTKQSRDPVLGGRGRRLKGKLERRFKGREMQRCVKDG